MSTTKAGTAALAVMKQTLRRATPATEKNQATSEAQTTAIDEPSRKARRSYIPRTYRPGNYCNHDPAAPKLEITPPPPRDGQPRNRPLILQKLHDRVQHFYANSQLLPVLRDCAVLRDGKRCPRRRRMRSERREAIVQLLRACVYFLDLTTLHLGRPTPAGFCWTVKEQMRALTNLGEKRFDRALRDLRSAGIVKIVERNKAVFVNGLEEFRAEPAIKIFSKSLFAAFSLGRWLEKEVEKARARHAQRKAAREKKKPNNEAGNGRLGMIKDQLTAMFRPAGRPSNGVKSGAQREREDVLRERSRLLAEFATANPQLTASEIRRTVDEAFRRRGIDILGLLRQTS